MQLATVRHLTETIVKHPLALVQYRRAKFKAMVAPQEELLIFIQLKPGDKKISGKFKITTSKNRQVAGGNFIFAKQP